MVSSSREPSAEHPLDMMSRHETDITLTREDIYDLRWMMKNVEGEIAKLWQEVDRRNEVERKKKDQISGLAWSTLTSVVKWFVMLALAGLAWFVKRAVEHE